MITETIINEAFAQLGVHPSDTKLLGGYHGNVFEVGRNEKFIVKIMESSVNPETSLLSELEWLDYLYSHGFYVARPLRVKGNTYIQQIKNEYYFVAYEKINGVHVGPNDKEIWGTALFEKWGEMLGKLHTVSKSYSTNHDRPQWFQNGILVNLETIHLQPQLVQKWKQYLKEFHVLPVSSENFGLIHGDLHHGNLLFSGNEITLIDFGDSEHHWFAYDVAIVIYHAALTVQKPERAEFVKQFYHSFMNGYARGNSNTSFTSHVDYFIEYRHLYSFTYHSLYADKSELTEQQLRYLQEMECSLIHDTPFLTVSL